MRKRGRRILAIAAVTMAGVMALTSCGQKSDTTTTKEEKPETGTSGEEGLSGEITIWHYHHTLEHEILVKTIKEYQEINPDVTINETFVSREELMNQYNIGAVSGELPDIGMVDSPDMSAYISLGVFDDITPELEEWGELDNFYEGPLNSCRDSDGNLYGLPTTSNCIALVCNMDMLKEAGFDKAPTTWDEFYEIAKACTNEAEGVYGYAMSAIATEEGTHQFIPWLYSTGETVASLDSEGGRKAMDFLAKLTDEGIMSKETTNWTQHEAFRSFCSGKAAMATVGTWHLAQVDEGEIETDVNMEFAPLPKDKQHSSSLGGENLGVCAGSENREIAIDFLKFVMTKEKNAEWCNAVTSQPVRRDSVELDGVWKEDERFALFTEVMDYAVARGPHPEWPTISEAIYRNEQAALLGDKTGEQAIADAAEIIKPILKETPINLD
jgi:multiple sugar transport system substrate-binding protein